MSTIKIQINNFFRLIISIVLIMSNICSISSLNTKNIKANTCYTNSLLQTNDIIFFQEHWLNNKEIEKMDHY